MITFEGTTLYVVYGWKVEGQALGKCLMDVSPAAVELGMKLVFPKDSKTGYFGQILAMAENEASVLQVARPTSGSAENMARALKEMGLDNHALEAPLILVVFG
jgi:hypothetical protein